MTFTFTFSFELIIQTIQMAPVCLLSVGNRSQSIVAKAASNSWENQDPHLMFIMSPENRSPPQTGP